MPDQTILDDHDAATPAAGAPPPLALPATLLGSAVLASCGGEGGAAPPALTLGSMSASSASVAAPTEAEAARFLVQAAMGVTRADIARVRELGFAGWLDEQFALPPTRSRFEALVAAGYAVPAYKNREDGLDPMCWRKLLGSPDTLRQRVTLALSEILVTSYAGLGASGWRTFSASVHMDNLEAHAFGNYRALLETVSLSVPMGDYLTYRGNRKHNPRTGTQPDENYARELMQLFTIGLVQLHLDGQPRLADGQPQDTYTQDDVTGLARVFTGWNYDLGASGSDSPEFVRRPMTQVAADHESGAKTFLGTTIADNTGGLASLQRALDTVFAHPNVAPFISRQLIQRLVCSNPSPGYIRRVATVFNDDGTGVKGNLRAVVRAILLDVEARDPSRLFDPGFGKLREPILRLSAWARAFGASSPSDSWGIGNTSDTARRLGQSPMRSSSVFNFFRPGYVPPNSALAERGLVAPEFQIANETTVVSYLNWMHVVITRGAGDVHADYRPLLPLADTAPALLAEIGLLLAAGQLGGATRERIAGAVDSMPKGSEAARLARIHATILLVMASPEFIVQK